MSMRGPRNFGCAPVRLSGTAFVRASTSRTAAIPPAPPVVAVGGQAVGVEARAPGEPQRARQVKALGGR
jgi:hypothetical protein